MLQSENPTARAKQSVLPNFLVWACSENGMKMEREMCPVWKSDFWLKQGLILPALCCQACPSSPGRPPQLPAWRLAPRTTLRQYSQCLGKVPVHLVWTLTWSGLTAIVYLLGLQETLSLSLSPLSLSLSRSLSLSLSLSFSLPRGCMCE